MKPKILIFIPHYIPGYKSGGPVRSIENIINNLHEDFDFYILTSDRDIGDVTPYKNILRHRWNKVGNAKVFYIDECDKKISFYKIFLTKCRFDIIYLNSFFNTNFTIKPLLALKLIKNPPPILLAPRGEFSQGALQLKTIKKRIFLALGKWIYKDISFHASSKYEEKDILSVLPEQKENRIFIALNPSKKTSFMPEESLLVNTSCLNMVFISRITPKKNLDYALKILQKIDIKATYDIYGPIEDKHYWEKCQSLIKTLPNNITCTYKGIVDPKEILQTFSQYDLFFFPTKGENYGHVIAESLAAGTQVLISDQTPWRNLDKLGIGWDLDIADIHAFREKLTFLGSSDHLKLDKMKIIENAQSLLINKVDIEANKNMFLSALKDTL